VQHLTAWLDDPAAPEPATVQAAGFQPSRLDTMRTRVSAACRGLYVLLQKEGDRLLLEGEDGGRRPQRAGIDIHHIFPRKWCGQNGVPARVYNSIVNKTAISYKANRKIGGNAPSHYLKQLESDKAVQLQPDAMDAILQTHLIDPALLRADDFQAFYAARKAALLCLIERAMGKAAVAGGTPVAEDDGEADDED
jgi:hypothetical protein